MAEEKNKPKKEKRPLAPRGRPEKSLKIDDTPRNVVRSFFGMRSTKCPDPKR